MHESGKSVIYRMRRLADLVIQESVHLDMHMPTIIHYNIGLIRNFPYSSRLGSVIWRNCVEKQRYRQGLHILLV